MKLASFDSSLLNAGGGMLRKIDAKNYHIGGADPPDKYTLERVQGGSPLIGVLGGNAPSNTISLKGYIVLE